MSSNTCLLGPLVGQHSAPVHDVGWVSVCVCVVAQDSDCGTAEEGIQTMSMWFIRDWDQTLLPSLAPLTGDRRSVLSPPAGERTLTRGMSEGVREENERRNREIEEGEGLLYGKAWMCNLLMLDKTYIKIKIKWKIVYDMFIS